MNLDKREQQTTRLVSRRQFIALVSAAGAGVVAAACATPAAPAPTAAPKATEAPKPAATTAPAPAATTAPAPATQAPATKLNFPAGKPITIYIGANAGGGMDVACRTLQPYLEKTLGTTVVPTNMPAAGGQASLSALKNAKPDGYILAMVSPPTHNALWLDPRRQPDFKRNDFYPLANHVWDPGVIMVHKDSPWKTVMDMTKAAKDSPGKYIITMSNQYGDDHFFIMDLMSKTGADFNVVNNDGAAPAVTQFVGNHADAIAFNESESKPLEKRGDGRILTVAHPQRTKYSPDIPTLREQGLDIISYSMRGYTGLATMPKPVLDFLAGAFKDAMSDPAHLAKMESLSYPVAYLGPADYMDAIKKEDAKITKLAKEFKLFDAIPQD